MKYPINKIIHSGKPYIIVHKDDADEFKEIYSMISNHTILWSITSEVPAPITESVTPVIDNDEENKWWTAPKLFIVEYNYGERQVRVWARYGKEGENPQNTFKGQFWYKDARVQAVYKAAYNGKNSLDLSMWSPVMDSTWLNKDTQPLQTEL